MILRYAPSKVRKALAAFDEAWAWHRSDVVHAYAEGLPHRNAKEAYIDANDFEEAAREREAEREFIDPVQPTLETLRVSLGEVEDALSAALASSVADDGLSYFLPPVSDVEAERRRALRSIAVLRRAWPLTCANSADQPRVRPGRFRFIVVLVRAD